MQPESLHAWLEKTAHLPHYVVLSNASEAKPLEHYYRLDGRFTAIGLYQGTPFEGWYEVMPYLVELSPDSAFIPWIMETQSRDWGWVAASPIAPSLIREHLTGLTKVFLPEGNEVFFRYWDGHYFAMHLALLETTWNQVLPVFSDYWVNGNTWHFSVKPEISAQAFPWWKVPQSVTDGILEQDITPVLKNILLGLKEGDAMTYYGLQKEILEHKVTYWIKRIGPKHPDLLSLISTRLSKELGHE